MDKSSPGTEGCRAPSSESPLSLMPSGPNRGRTESSSPHRGCVDTASALREPWEDGDTGLWRHNKHSSQSSSESQTGRQQNRENAGGMRYRPTSLPQKGDDKQIGKESNDLVYSFLYSSISPMNICSTFPDSSVGKESACNFRRPWFDSWVGKIPWRRKRLLTPIFWPGEFHELYSSWGHKERDMTE